MSHDTLQARAVPPWHVSTTTAPASAGLTAPALDNTPAGGNQADLLGRFVTSFLTAPGSFRNLLMAPPGGQFVDNALNRSLEFHLGFQPGSVRGIQLREQGGGFREAHLIMPGAGVHAAFVVDPRTGHLHHPFFRTLPNAAGGAPVSAAPSPESTPFDALLASLARDARELLDRWDDPAAGSARERLLFDRQVRQALGLPADLDFTVHRRRTERGMTYVFRSNESHPRLLGALTVNDSTGEIWTNRYSAWRQRDLEIEIRRRFDIPPDAQGFRFSYDRAGDGNLVVQLSHGTTPIGVVSATPDYTRVLAGPTGGSETAGNTVIRRDDSGQITTIRFRSDPNSFIQVRDGHAYLCDFRNGHAVRTPIAELQLEGGTVSYLSYVDRRWMRNIVDATGNRVTAPHQRFPGT